MEETDILAAGYGIMPLAVFYDPNLMPNSKLLYVLLSSLCSEKGYCWASNDYLCEKMLLKERQLQNCLKQLAKYLEITNPSTVKRCIKMRGTTQYNAGSKPVYNNINIISRKLEFTDEEMNEYQIKFPRIDVYQEREKAKIWLEENGKAKVTYRGFFTRWLMNSRPSSRAADPKPAKPTEPEAFHVTRL